MIIEERQKRGWTLIAVIAIGLALVLLLVAHAQGSDTPDSLALLPVLFIGLVAPLSLLSPKSSWRLGRTPEPPVLACAFQRPPPRHIA